MGLKLAMTNLTPIDCTVSGLSKSKSASKLRFSRCIYEHDVFLT